MGYKTTWTCQEEEKNCGERSSDKKKNENKNVRTRVVRNAGGKKVVD